MAEKALAENEPIDGLLGIDDKQAMAMKLFLHLRESQQTWHIALHMQDCHAVEADSMLCCCQGSLKGPH